MTIRPGRPEDAAAVAAIYNAGIAEGGATFETTPRTAADIGARLADRDRFPLVVAEDDEGRVVGWAGTSPYRARACYAGIAEFSVYVSPEARGRRLGRRLLEALIDAARDAGYWKLLSRVFPFNAASLGACRAAGFLEAGVYRRHGYLNGRWHDAVIVERLITENQTPSGVRFRQAREADWDAIARLLTETALPLDGARDHLDSFVVAVREEDIVGVAAVEDGGGAVLLRSVVLRPAERGTGTGRLLVERVLERAQRGGAAEAYLLTTTAEAFFTRLGFQKTTRDEVPAALRGSAELGGACPATAVVMKKGLGLKA